jgi:hypothetical protein
MDKLLITLFALISLSTNTNCADQNTSITVSEPAYDSIDGTLTRPVNITAFNKYTGEEYTIGVIDLNGFNVKEISYTSFWLFDWKRNRAIVSFDRQTIVPDYQIIDINSLSIYPLQGDSLRNTEGNIYITPDCNYIVVFGRKYTSDKGFREDPSILYTCTFDADNYEPIATIRGISVVGFSIPSDFFIPQGDSIIFISDPMSYRSDNSIVKLSLPDLRILDTLVLADYCSQKPNYSFVYDAGANNVLFYIKCDSIHSQYKLINIHTKKLVGELIEDNPHACEYGRLSDDEKFIALHSGDKITIYNSTFSKLYQIDNVGFYSLRWAYFKNGILVANSKEEGILNKYDIATSALLERIQIHEVQH